MVVWQTGERDAGSRRHSLCWSGRKGHQSTHPRKSVIRGRLNPVKLEELHPHARVEGIGTDGAVTIIRAKWHGSQAVEVTYRTSSRQTSTKVLYRSDEADLEALYEARPWTFDADGALFRLVSEAQRIRLAHLFDPLLAVHTSLVEPLPHQITAVYESMLPRQPLRFLLADDPGSGKTIMAGLLMKELIARGDLERCLVVCPGSLAEQWQEELERRFHLSFAVYSSEALQAARPGNWFEQNDLVIARLDMLSRNEDVQELLKAPDCRWDLVVCDEAHKMSAAYFGRKARYTKRYRLGQLLGRLTRHFLLMTATPHNGKEDDFQLFMALLDGDRFEGRFRAGVHRGDTSDLMRRMVKEKLLKFDGTPLFPVRRAYTVPYKLSEAETSLYHAVTHYVRREFDRAERLEGKKRTTVGFALTILQRRLASSPEAIHRSLRRRRRRLQGRIKELEDLLRDAATESALAFSGPELDPDDLEDLEDAPEGEFEATEGEVFDQATAARSSSELRAEIDTLLRLERLARDVLNRSDDTKWRELAGLLNKIFTPGALARRTKEPTIPYGAGPVPASTALPRPEARRLHRAQGHAQLPERPHHDRHRAARGRGRHTWGAEQARSAEGAGGVPARPPGQGIACDRRSGGGDQPAARPPDGELRPAVESQPARAALRPHPPDWSDRSLPPVESRRRGHSRGGRSIRRC